MSNLTLSLNNYNIVSENTAINQTIGDMYLMDNQDLSQNTLKSYTTYLKQFFIWLKDKGIDKPTEDTIKTYKLYLKESETYSVSTKNQYIRAVKHLFKWLNSRGLYYDVSANIKEFKDTKKHKRDSFTINEVNKIVNDIDTSSEVGLRDKAIIILISVLGLRANEVVNININDIEQKDNYCIVNILGKGYTEKIQKKVIPKQVYLVIQDYLKVKKISKPNDALFTSTSNRALNKRLTKETLSQIIKNRFRASGFNSSKLTLHSLRHLTADATLLATDNNIYKTQKYLRHRNTATTEIYLSEQADIDVSLANDVYNTIFDNAVIDKTKALKDIINTLDTSEIDNVINYINDLKTNRGGV